MFNLTFKLWRGVRHLAWVKVVSEMEMESEMEVEVVDVEVEVEK